MSLLYYHTTDVKTNTAQNIDDSLFQESSFHPSNDDQKRSYKNVETYQDAATGLHILSTYSWDILCQGSHSEMTAKVLFFALNDIPYPKKKLFESVEYDSDRNRMIITFDDDKISFIQTEHLDHITIEDLMAILKVYL